MKKIAAFLLAVCLVVAAPVVTCAEQNLTYESGKTGGYQCRTEAELFFETDDEENDYSEMYILDDYSLENRNISSINGLKIYEHFSTRKLMKSIHLTVDRTALEHYEIYIPEGKTLTIDKGVILTLRGKLRVDGTIVNNGTIVVDGKRDVKRNVLKEDTHYSGFKTKYSWSWDYSDDADGMVRFYGNIVNNGVIENAGEIRITCGQLENDNGGVLQNSGSITVKNIESKLHGIVNTTKTKDGKPLVSSIVNDGTIRLEGPAGYGIESNKGSVIENDGSITLSGKAEVKGKVTGNKPKAM